jgi:hypothetical protein
MGFSREHLSLFKGGGENHRERRREVSYINEH